MKDPFADAVAWLPDDYRDVLDRLDAVIFHLEMASQDAAEVRHCRATLLRLAAQAEARAALAPTPSKPRPGDLQQLTSAQLADLICVSPRTLWRYVKSGKLPKPVRYSRGCVRWRAADLAQLPT